LLEQSKSKMQGLSKSKSNVSVASDSKLGNQVRTLKGELENERKVKDRALEILKKLHKDTNGSPKEIDDFLRNYTKNK